MNVHITNGVIKYGQTVKTGDYENKRADVELSFNVAEGQDVAQAMGYVAMHAQHQLHVLLGLASPKADAVKQMLDSAPTKVAEPAKPAPAKKAPAAPKVPAAKAADAAAMMEEETPPAAEAKKAAEEENLDDLLGTGAALPPVTDKALNDETQKVAQATKNNTAIRKILTDILAAEGIKVPPGRIIDIPQGKRQEYLDAIKEIKPVE